MRDRALLHRSRWRRLPVAAPGIPSFHHPAALRRATPCAVRKPRRCSLGVKIGVPEQSLGSTHFVVALPLRNEAELDRTLEAISDPQSPQYRQFISRSAFLERYAPSAANLAALARELQRNGFTVSVMDQAVLVGGTQPQVERYFERRSNAPARARTVAAFGAPRAERPEFAQRAHHRPLGNARHANLLAHRSGDGRAAGQLRQQGRTVLRGRSQTSVCDAELSRIDRQAARRSRSSSTLRSNNQDLNAYFKTCVCPIRRRSPSRRSTAAAPARADSVKEPSTSSSRPASSPARSS